MASRRGPSDAARLPLEEVHLVHVDRLAVAEEQDHDREADAHLGGRHGDHEQGEDLTVDVLELRPRTRPGSR